MVAALFGGLTVFAYQPKLQGGINYTIYNSV